jgi:hypothetical protein
MMCYLTFRVQFMRMQTRELGFRFNAGRVVLLDRPVSAYHFPRGALTLCPQLTLYGHSTPRLLSHAER